MPAWLRSFTIIVLPFAIAKQWHVLVVCNAYCGRVRVWPPEQYCRLLPYLYVYMYMYLG